MRGGGGGGGAGGGFGKDSTPLGQVVPLLPSANPNGASRPQLQSIPLTKDHKPTDPLERQRLLECRAIVRPSRVQNPATGRFVEVGCMRVWDVGEIYGVAMSRAMGHWTSTHS